MCHYSLYYLCRMSPMFFQNLRPDDRAFNSLCPMAVIEFNCLPSIKHFVNYGHNPPDAWQDSWVERQRSRWRVPTQAGSTTAVSSTHQLLGLKHALKVRIVLRGKLNRGCLNSMLSSVLQQSFLLGSKGPSKH